MRELTDRAIGGLAGDLRPQTQQQWAAGDIQRPQVGAAECTVGDRVDGSFGVGQQLSFRRNHVNSGPSRERFTGFAGLVKPCSDIQVSFGVDIHSVTTAARIEVDQRARF